MILLRPIPSVLQIADMWPDVTFLFRKKVIIYQRSTGCEVHNEIESVAFEDHFTKIDNVFVFYGRKSTNLILHEFDFGNASKFLCV